MENPKKTPSVAKLANALKTPGGKLLTTLIFIGGLVGGLLTTEVEAAKKKKPPRKIVPPAGMVYVPAGCFKMGTPDGQPGDDDERPYHEHCLPNGYFIDKYEMTVADYKALVEAGKVPPYVIITPEGKDPAKLWNYPAKLDHPMNGMSWEMAKAACGAQGKRLPTETEWEYAARGPDGRKYPWGNTEPTPGVEANFGRPYQTERAETDPVGSHPQGTSFFGAKDMGGNVKEFVEDWRQAGNYNYKNSAKAHLVPKSGQYKGLKGGAFCPLSVEVDPIDNADPSYRLRISSRDGIELGYGGPDIGVRCAQDLPPQ